MRFSSASRTRACRSAAARGLGADGRAIVRTGVGGSILSVRMGTFGR